MLQSRDGLGRLTVPRPRRESSPLAVLSPEDSASDDDNDGRRTWIVQHDDIARDTPDDNDTACLLYDVTRETTFDTVNGEQTQPMSQSRRARRKEIATTLASADSGHASSGFNSASANSRRVSRTEKPKSDRRSSYGSIQRSRSRPSTPLQSARNRSASDGEDGHADGEGGDTLGSNFGRIAFADTVRICGGIRSGVDLHEKLRRGSVRSVASVNGPPAGYTFPSSDGPAITSPVPSYFHGIGIGRPHSLSFGQSSQQQQPLMAMSATSSSRRPSSNPLSRSGSIFGSDMDDASTAGMYISRASTPASLYAPLLMPSKTAPSPSRTFYLTYGASKDGQTTYRELVRKQLEAREARARAKRRKESRRWWANFVTCGWHGRRRKRLRRMAEESGERERLVCTTTTTDEEEEDEDEEDEREQTALLRDLEAQLAAREEEQGRGGLASAEEADARDEGAYRSSGDASRPRFKSEVQVMFGSAPCRWMRWDYWVYKCSREEQ